ncbi:MAG: hypothetical protein WBH00_13125 [Xanthobacteraceae bacterium]
MTADILQSMSSLLAASGCDLGDEREVLRTLRSAGHHDGDIIVLSDEATERARAIRQRPTAGDLSALVAIVLFISSVAV